MLREILNETRLEYGEKYYTHIAIKNDRYGGGKFCMERKHIAPLYKNCAGYNICEVPFQGYQMFVVDIDHKEEGDVAKSLYDIKEVKKYIRIINNVLKKKGLKDKELDCLYLTKPPYVSGNYVKNGYHIQYPNLFMSIKEMKQVEEELEEKIDGYDKMAGKPWLMYGCCKNDKSGVYTPKTIYTHDGKEEDPDEYFVKNEYLIYDVYEKRIEITAENVKSLYPRILSIVLFFRKPSKLVFEVKDKVNMSVFTTECIEEDSENFEDDEIDELYSQLKDSRFEETNSWSILIYLIRMLGGSLNLALHHSSRGGREYDRKATEDKYNRYNKSFNFSWAKLALKNLLYEDTGKDFSQNKLLFTEKKNNDEYLKQVEYNLVKKNLKYLTEIDEDVIEKDDMYVDEKIYENRERICLVKAPLGSGKSTSVNKYIKSYHKEYDFIIVLTPRQSYARNACQRLRKSTGLDFRCYLDIKKKMLDQDITTKYIVIQVESLLRLNPIYYSNYNTLIIADEIEASLTQLTSMATHKEKHSQNVDTFVKMMTFAKKIICVDAFLSNRTINVFRDLGLFNSKVYHYTKRPRKKQVVLRSSMKSLLYDMRRCLERGEKIVLFSTSNRKLTKTIKRKKGVDVSVLDWLEREFPDKSVCQYTSNYKQDNLTDIQNTWTKCDVLVYTSTITVGLDFNIPDIFSEMFLYANTSSKNLVRDVFQALQRVRNFKNNKLTCFLDDRYYGFNSKSKYPISLKKIKQMEETKSFYVKAFLERYYMPKSERHTTSFPYCPDWLMNLYYFNKLEHHSSIIKMKEMFFAYFDICNYEIVNTDMEIEEDLDENYEIEKEIEYTEIAEITREGYTTLLKKKQRGEPMTTKEKMEYHKYRFHSLLIDDAFNQKECAIVWKTYIKGIGRFYNLATEKALNMNGDKLPEAIQHLILQKDNGNYVEFADTRIFQAIMLKDTCEKLGLPHSCSYGKIIPRGVLEKVIKEMDRKQFESVFSLPKPRKSKKGGDDAFRSGLYTLNKGFEKFSTSKIVRGKRERKGKGGQKADTSDFVLKNTANNEGVNIYDGIKPRDIEM